MDIDGENTAKRRSRIALIQGIKMLLSTSIHTKSLNNWLCICINTFFVFLMIKSNLCHRSYYRCTTQKCTVKKRVERSYQDPTIVITTYEGQHTHQSPATLRGNSHILASSSSSIVPPGFPQQLLMHQMPSLNINHHHQQQMDANPSMFLQSLQTPLHQQFQIPDNYGLLQDIIPTLIHNNHPWNIYIYYLL